jgi:hypothetical protein
MSCKEFFSRHIPATGPGFPDVCFWLRYARRWIWEGKTWGREEDMGVESDGSFLCFDGFFLLLQVKPGFD